MLKYVILVFISFVSIVVCANTENTKKNPKNQVEDIFIWKISDELQLSAKQEKEFGDIHRSLNKKKSEITEEIKLTQSDIRKNEKPLSKAEQLKLIQKNRQLLQQLNQLNVDEFDSMKKLLGPEKFLSYLFLKQEINTKFKSMVLGRPAEKQKDGEKSKATEPVVVEER
jgi:hypothetical protein